MWDRMKLRRSGSSFFRAAAGYGIPAVRTDAPTNWPLQRRKYSVRPQDRK